jgi:hypothetical protein
MDVLRSLPVFVLLVALSVPGCGPSCPNPPTGCYPGTTLIVPLPAGTPEAYELSLSFRVGDTVDTDRCLVILPPPEDWGANLAASCQGGLVSVYVQRNLDADCSVTYPLGASCSVNANGFGLVIRRSQRVDEISVQMKREGVSFAPLVLAPAYEVFHPDGPECPGSCDVSEQVIAFDALVTPVGESG